ncbi:Serine/threonine protein kinase [Hyella patelloides LEGE 07179]|uniref:non-specific serine/threonine protein kinase n=1 Tax=Hyella patelloides LEGE 07179 TaxID=945734 RepID=A0A563W083_9CYAN|nr:serine/threonine-protein kinase [Hyella patelloides]VEP17045.1 Serine/threonine protein kinase [Hyella patelloides LEGE 07179]
MSYCFNPYCQKPQNLTTEKFCLNCQTPLVLQNRYSALKIIGQGGMGRTFLVVDKKDKTRESYCVIKQLFSQTLAININSRQKATELFIAEAATLDKLGQHPQIPQLYDYFTENEYQYLVQEWIEGDNLIQVIKKEGIIQEKGLVQILKDLLPVLLFVHEYQIIHRDIKPENIIRRTDGTLVLVDFGAAKTFTEKALQQTGTIIGSPEYIAPEQLRGKATFSSDIYSLGVTCLYLLTEISPFDLYSDSEDNWIWRDYLVDKFISLELSTIIDKMIARATARRYQSIQKVLQDLNDRISYFPELVSFSQKKALEMLPTKPKELTLISQSGIDYTQLKDYLKAQKWQEANQITEKLLLKAAHQERKNWLERDDLKNLNCEDLYIIDRLWSYYSEERFGFSVQHSIWYNLEIKKYQYFGEQIGWYQEKKWLLIKHINFSLSAPKGHLPVLSWWFGHAIWGLKGLFSYIDTCKIEEFPKFNLQNIED